MKDIIYKHVIESLKDIIITVYDYDLVIRYVSNSNKLSELNKEDGTDYSISNMIGKTIDQAYPRDIVIQYKPYWQLAIRDECANTILACHNNRYWLQKFLPVYNNEDKIVAGMVISEDITKSYTDSREVKKKERQIQEMSKLASHGMRSPVATLMGLLSLIEEEIPKYKSSSDLHILISNLKVPILRLNEVIAEINDKANELWNTET